MVCKSDDMFHRAIFDGKKPYNPVLGETCAWGFGHGEDGITRMVCEQVFSQTSFAVVQLGFQTVKWILSRNLDSKVQTLVCRSRTILRYRRSTSQTIPSESP